MKKLSLAVAAMFVFAICLTSCGGGGNGGGGGASNPIFNPEASALEGKWLALTGCFVMFTGNMIYEGGIDSGVARGYFTITGSKVNVNWVEYTYDITADPVVWGARPGFVPASDEIDYTLNGDTLKWYNLAEYKKMGPSFDTSNLNTTDMQRAEGTWMGGGAMFIFHDYRVITEGGKTYYLLAYTRGASEGGGCALYSNGDIVFSPSVVWGKVQYKGTYTMPDNTHLNIIIGGTTYNLTKYGS